MKALDRHAPIVVVAKGPIDRTGHEEIVDGPAECPTRGFDIGQRKSERFKSTLA